MRSVRASRTITYATVTPLAVAVLLAAAPAAAQTPPDTVTVVGRVYDAESQQGIRNAMVVLEGVGATLTSPSGAFRFTGVELGEYPLRIQAFGYRDHDEMLSVFRDLEIQIPLEISPLPLDSVVVQPRLIDIVGDVRDPTRDLLLMDAEVTTDQVAVVYTNPNGRFNLDDVLDAIPLTVRIRAFGYHPLDTVFVPDDDVRYHFELEPDALADALITVETRRIDQLITATHAVGIPGMDREAILGYAGHSTVRDMLVSEYRYQLPRVACVVIDEKQVQGGTPASFILGTMVPEELEKLDFLFGGRMLRIYTRTFIQYRTTTYEPLREPSISPPGTGTALCT